MAVPLLGAGLLGAGLADLEAALRGLPVAQAAFGAALAACLVSGGRERAAGVAAAARGALQGGSAAVAADPVMGSSIVQLEDVLCLVGRLAGADAKPTITEAKRLLRLRSLGGAALASRVGRLSKGRNVLGHPDVGLESDIERLFCLRSCGAGSDDECASGGAPCHLGTDGLSRGSLPTAVAQLFDIYDQSFASIGSQTGSFDERESMPGANNSSGSLPTAIGQLFDISDQTFASIGLQTESFDEGELTPAEDNSSGSLPSEWSDSCDLFLNELDAKGFLFSSSGFALLSEYHKVMESRVDYTAGRTRKKGKKEAPEAAVGQLCDISDQTLASTGSQAGTFVDVAGPRLSQQQQQQQQQLQLQMQQQQRLLVMEAHLLNTHAHCDKMNAERALRRVGREFCRPP